MHLDSGLRGHIQAVIEEATATPKRDARKKPPPPPPRRQSSSLAKNTRLTQSQTSLLSLNDQLDSLRLSQLSLNSIQSNDSHQSLQSQATNKTRSNRNSVLSETDSETMFARVQDKSCVSAAAAYPSMCNVTPMNSDDDEPDVNVKANAGGQREAKHIATSQAHDKLNLVSTQPRTPVTTTF